MKVVAAFIFVSMLYFMDLITRDDGKVIHYKMYDIKIKQDVVFYHKALDV